MVISNPKEMNESAKKPNPLMQRDRPKKIFKIKLSKKKEKKPKRWISNMRRCSRLKISKKLMKIRRSKKRFKEKMSKLLT